MTNIEAAQEILDEIAEKMEDMFATSDKTYQSDFWDVWQTVVDDMEIENIDDECIFGVEYKVDEMSPKPRMYIVEDE